MTELIIDICNNIDTLNMLQINKESQKEKHNSNRAFKLYNRHPFYHIFPSKSLIRNLFLVIFEITIHGFILIITMAIIGNYIVNILTEF